MIKERDIIILSDEQTLEDLTDLSKGGLEVTVSKIWTHESGPMKYVACELENSQLVIVFKYVDGKLEQRAVYYQCNDFVPGSREEVVNNGSFWIFKEPEDTNNIVYDELEFADKITDNDGSFNRFTTSYNEDASSIVVEWQADYETENPYLILFERGDYLQCLQGAEIRESELTIFNRS